MINHFDIRLTPQELDLIANVLAQRPWQEVNALLSNLKAQVDMAQKQNADPHVGVQQINGHDQAQSVN